MGTAHPPCPVWLLLPSTTARALHARSLHRRRRSSLFRYLITLSPENRLARSLSVAATEKKTGAAQAGDSEIDGTSKVEGEEGRGATDRAATIEVRGDQTGIGIFHNFLRQRRLFQHPPPASQSEGGTSRDSLGRRRGDGGGMLSKQSIREMEGERRMGAQSAAAASARKTDIHHHHRGIAAVDVAAAARREIAF